MSVSAFDVAMMRGSAEGPGAEARRRPVKPSPAPFTSEQQAALDAMIAVAVQQAVAETIRKLNVRARRTLDGFKPRKAS